MSDSVGIGSWMWLIIAAIILGGLAFGFYRWRAMQLGMPRDHDDLFDEAEAEGRLEVLESTPVDAQRRLLLVRCDNVEHLIMVGGPADLVVESDVRKSRASKGSARQSAESPARIASTPADRGAPERADMPAPRRSEPAVPPPEAQSRPEPMLPEAKPAALFGPDSKAAQLGPGAAERKQDETKLIEAKPPETRPGDVPARLSAPSRPTLTAVPGAAIQPVGRKDGQAAIAPAPGQDRRNGEAAAGPRIDDAGDARPGRSRPRGPEMQPPARREPQPSLERRTPAVQPAALSASRDDERNRVQPAANRDGPAPAEKRGNGAGNDQASPRAAILPPAEVPWPEPDSVESEISRALSESPVPPRHGAQATAGKSDPATTLGDLAERLEEALAREVQSANQGRGRLDSSIDAFSFDREVAENHAPEQAQQTPQKERREPAKVMPSAPEAEARRDARPQPERPEEAPVINLHQRRRETVDPLEDEMARLLGELTGDTNRR